ncbi:hypothetical protein BaRGS_00031405 [Batillaria attramentaria]|uniref:Uncharacterized protein n=1 Tax=Batillaria attramentaria TaxID=370345 RepID=A0ABD0JRN9_9CAEN
MLRIVRSLNFNSNLYNKNLRTNDNSDYRATNHKSACVVTAGLSTSKDRPTKKEMVLKKLNRQHGFESSLTESPCSETENRAGGAGEGKTLNPLSLSSLLHLQPSPAVTELRRGGRGGGVL